MRLAPLEVWDWIGCITKGLILSPSPLKCISMTGQGKGPSVFVISCVAQWDLLPYEPRNLQPLHYVRSQLVQGLPMESQLWTPKPAVRSSACCWGGMVRLLLTWRCSVSPGVQSGPSVTDTGWSEKCMPVFFLSFSYQRDTHSFHAKGRKSQGPMLVSLLELSRISLSWIVKLMCSCRNCCQLLPRCCLMAK